MKAKRIDGQTPGGKRNCLAKALPLETPYLVQIFPVYGCNFKCNYCIHSTKKDTRGYVSNAAIMDLGLYKKCIDDLVEFPQKVKMLRFAGTGEPLLHKNIVEMIAYANEKGVTDNIDIVTNGTLLTQSMADGLINAGLTKLRISIQGLNSKKYEDISHIRIDFKEFIDNLRYFYENKKKTKVYIKVIDCALEKDEEEKFFEIFGDICDEIAVEHLFPAVHQIDYDAMYRDESKELPQNGINVSEAEVCPQPFYLMQINPDGKVVPCCSMQDNPIVGDCTKKSLYDIWHSTVFNMLRRNQLINNKTVYTGCKDCSHYKYGMFIEDILDNEKKILLKIFQERK